MRRTAVELWLVEKKRKNTQSGSRGRIVPEMLSSSEDDSRVCGPGVGPISRMQLL